MLTPTLLPYTNHTLTAKLFLAPTPENKRTKKDRCPLRQPRDAIHRRNQKRAGALMNLSDGSGDVVCDLTFCAESRKRFINVNIAH